MGTVELKNVGPIEDIVFDLPEQKGGVKILKGTSGAGKTTALRALSGLVGNKDMLTGLSPRDGEDRGEVCGLGRTVRIGQKVTTAGACSVLHLGGLDLGVLVDPKVTDPAARLKQRVRFLASLGGKQLEPRDLLGAHYETFAQSIDLDEVKSIDDPVMMADKIKRAIDSAALERERESERLRGMASAKRQEAGDIEELESRVSYEGAVEAHRAALQASGEAKAKRDRWIEITERNKKIDEQLAESEQIDDGAIDAVKGLVADWSAHVESLEEKLADAKLKRAKAINDLGLLAKQKEMLDKLRAQIEDPGEPVTEDRIAEWEACEQKALKLLNLAASIEKRKQALSDARSLEERARAAVKFAEQARDVAKQVQDEVQKALPEGPIQIEDGALVVHHAKRGAKVEFDELSTGERWKAAMQYAIFAVGKGGVIPLAQESWQALAPELRREIAELCADEQVWLVSGEVAEGPLRVEDFESSPIGKSNLELAS